MCGIVGYMRLNGEDLSDQSLDAFTDSLAHRGPDSRGTWRDRRAGISLGNRRLAGIDLSSAGTQPMSYAKERFWITFNGTIYNYLEVREELKSKGYAFQSNSDTEVILAAYAAWGPDCQFKLNGDWAFAIWDRREAELFVSRDRFGGKPFFWWRMPAGIAFASELKAFVGIPEFRWSFDEELVAETLTNINGIEGTEWTYFKGVKRLRGGHHMIIKAGQEPRITRWWQTYDHLPKVAATFTDQVDEFRELFFDAVRLRLRSDRQVVTNLSGGLDSSSVTSAVAHLRGQAGLLPADQRAYVAKFTGTDQDEVEYARAVVAASHVTPVYLDINVDEILGAVEDLIWHYEDIFWVLPVGQWLILKEMFAREGLVVTLDGGGGDDMLCSLSFFIMNEMERCLLRGDLKRFRELRQVVAGMAGGNDPGRVNPLFFLRRALSRTPLGRHQIAPLINEWMPLSAEHWLKGRVTHRRLYDDFMAKQVPFPSGLNRDHYWWFHNTGVPTIGRTYDRSAVAQGVEVRMPFLDWRLVAYAFALPDASKVGGGYTKRILREAMRGYVPDVVRLRTSKTGFSSPMEQWLKGPLKPWLMQVISDQDFLTSSIWDGPRIRAYILRSLDTQAWSNLPKMWPFIQAHLLMNVFHKRAKSLSHLPAA